MSKEGNRDTVLDNMKVRTKLKPDASWMQPRDTTEPTTSSEEEKPWLAEVRARRLNGAPTSPVSSPISSTPPPMTADTENKTPTQGYLIRGVFTKVEKPASPPPPNGTSTKTRQFTKKPSETYKLIAPHTVRSTSHPEDSLLSPEEQEKRREAASNVLNRSSVRQRSYVLSAAKKYEAKEASPDPLPFGNSSSFVAKKVEVTDDESAAAPAPPPASSASPSPAGAETSAASAPEPKPRRTGSTVVKTTADPAVNEPVIPKVEKAKEETPKTNLLENSKTDSKNVVIAELVQVTSSDPQSDDSGISDTPLSDALPTLKAAASPALPLAEPGSAAPASAARETPVPIPRLSQSPTSASTAPANLAVTPAGSKSAVTELAVETKSAPVAEPKPKREPEPQPKPKPEPKVEPKPEPKVEPKPEPKVEPKPEPKVEPKPEPKVEPKPEPKVEPKPEPKVEPKPEPKVEPKPEPKVEPKPELELKPEAEAKKEPTSESAPKPSSSSDLLTALSDILNYFVNSDSCRTAKDPTPLSNTEPRTDDLLGFNDSQDELEAPVPASPGRWSQDLLSEFHSESNPIKTVGSVDLQAKTNRVVDPKPSSIREAEEKQTDKTAEKTQSSTDPFDPYPIGTTSHSSPSDLLQPAISISSSSPSSTVTKSLNTEKNNALESLAHDIIPINTDTLRSQQPGKTSPPRQTNTEEESQEAKAEEEEEESVDEQTVIMFERKSKESDSPWDKWTSPTVYTLHGSEDEEEEEEEEEAVEKRSATSSAAVVEEEKQVVTPEPKKGLVLVKEYVNVSELSLQNPRDQINGDSDYLTSSSAVYSYSSPSNYSSVSQSSTCTYCGKQVGNDAKISIDHLSIHCHPACFKCGVCSKPMGDLLLNMFIHAGKVHCDGCYANVV